MRSQLKRLEQNPAFVVRGDASGPVHTRQWFEIPGRDDGNPEAWCYTDRLSYQAGERITLFAISTESKLLIRLRSERTQRQDILEVKPVAARWADTGPLASVNGCSWPAVAQIPVEKEWPSGVYTISLYSVDSDKQYPLATHLFVVRPSSRPDSDRFLLITADSTWNAYNDWGGSNHYEGTIKPDSNLFSPRLSNQRPFARGMIDLPADAPRTLPRHSPEQRFEVRYDHMEWAWVEGYSKKYASAGWAMYERPFAHWAESAGYRFDIATHHDLHFRPEITTGYSCVVMVGHDEYWTWDMRDAIDHYVEHGGRVARFAGNFFWQTRLQDEGRTQICHKYSALEEDPYRDEKDRQLITTCWEADEVGRPGHASFGLDGSRGVYAGWGGLAPNGPAGFIVYRPEHWALENSGLGYGDLLGSSGRVFGYEVDGLDYVMRDGLPYPVPKPALPKDLAILAYSPARLREDGFGTDPDGLFVGDEDARFIARLRYRSEDEDALRRVNHGSGMVVSFTRGEGEVFHAGTTEWVAGLIRKDPAVEKVTHNVLCRFLNRSKD